MKQLLQDTMSSTSPSQDSPQASGASASSASPGNSERAAALPTTGEASLGNEEIAGWMSPDGETSAAPADEGSSATLDVQPAVLTTYSVRGRTLREAGEAMMRRGAEWGKVSWKSKLSVAEPRKGPTRQVRVTVTTQKEMPIWSGYAQATPAEQREWDRFYAALDRHEEGHIYVVEEGYRGIADAILGLTRTEGEALLRSRDAEVAASSRDHDAKTNSGLNQGTEIQLP